MHADVAHDAEQRLVHLEVFAHDPLRGFEKSPGLAMLAIQIEIGCCLSATCAIHTHDVVGKIDVVFQARRKADIRQQQRPLPDPLQPFTELLIGNLRAGAQQDAAFLPVMCAEVEHDNVVGLQSRRQRFREKRLEFVGAWIDQVMLPFGADAEPFGQCRTDQLA